MAFSNKQKLILIGVTAVMLAAGTATFAASAPGGSRPRVTDLPVISLTRAVDEAAAPLPIATVETSIAPVVPAADPPHPPAASSPKPPHAPTASHDDDGDREVVSPPVRDDDPDHDDDDDADNGESSSQKDSPDTD